MQKQKKVISLEIDDGGVVATALSARKKQIHLDRYAIALSLKELAADLFFKAAEVVINLPSQIVLFRSFHLAPSFFKEKNMQKEISAFLQRQNLPFKLEECYWNWFTNDSNLSLIAARKEAVEKYIAFVQEAGFRVIGVCTPLIALYNVLIHTHCERAKDRFVLLNIKTSSSDLVIYESRRLWIYPLSTGSRNLHESKDSVEAFSGEAQRIFNAHYLQNPLAGQNAPNYFYITGKGSLEPLAAFLKKLFSDFEIITLDPLKTIETSLKSKEYPINQQALSLSLGLGLTYLNIPFGLKVNLIEEKIKKAKQSAVFNVLKSAIFFFAVLLAAGILFIDIKLLNDLKAQTAIYKNSELQVSTILPEIKVLKEENEKLKKLEGFLTNKLNQQDLYLKALAVVSQTKPSSVEIKEFDAQIKEATFEVIISGTASEYEYINMFLNELKKNNNLKDVKVIASTVPEAEAEAKEIDFKLRFEIPGSRIEGIKKE
jgi:hypothetical protein